MVLQYYYVLRSVLLASPHLRQCLTRCKHCRIFFLTHPRNAGRSDLMCPFGCRQAHRKECSTKRSTEYYRTNEGKAKKKALNEQRRSSQEQQACNVDQAGNAGGNGGDSSDTNNEKPSGQASESACASETVCAPEPVYNEVTVHYLQMLIGLIEGRWVSMDEILAMLEKIMRQHSMGKRKRFRYDFAYPRAEVP
jgi:hypothetical protein